MVRLLLRVGVLVVSLWVPSRLIAALLGENGVTTHELETSAQADMESRPQADEDISP